MDPQSLGHPGEKLTITPSIPSELIYLPNLVQGSLRCTYDKVEDRDFVHDVLGRLPQVEGLRWIVGNPPTVCRILANHLEETRNYLLPDVYTWTTDTFELPEYAFSRLIIGYFGSRGVRIIDSPPYKGPDQIGLFVLGVPDKE